jgi:hypothetical protein
MPFVTDDAPPSDLLQRRTVILPSLLCVMSRIRGYHLIRRHYDGILREDLRVALSTLSVVWVY